MKNRYSLWTALFVLMLLASACAAQPSNATQAPSSDDQLATIVAGTMQALTLPAPEATAEPPVSTEEILPHSFYYLGTDNKTGLTQVFRIEQDGATTHQVTFEPINVDSYDVSPIDGSVAYVANNQLLSINADGSNRSMLVEGGTVDTNNQMGTSLSNPVFSPDALTIVYGLRGLNLYSIIDGVSNQILPEKIDPSTGAVRELYVPKNFSPDGTKLLITTAIPNSDGISSALFLLASKSIVRLTGEGAVFCCAEQGWTSDSTALYSANPTMGMFSSGLWRVDAASGIVNPLIPSDAGDGTFNLPDAPFLAPDGQLYYFFTTSSLSDGFIDRSPLQLVRSAIDGVTGRTVLRSDNFQLMNEALWAPDASFVIVALAPIMDVRVGGQAEVTYVDGRPSIVLTTFAQSMKWGP